MPDGFEDSQNRIDIRECVMMCCSLYSTLYSCVAL